METVRIIASITAAAVALVCIFIDRPAYAAYFIGLACWIK